MTNPDVRIVVGFDGSDDSLAALGFGAAEAIARGGELLLAYAVDDTVLNSAWGIVFDVDGVRAEGQKLLQVARKQAVELGLSDDAVLTETHVGQPAQVLTKLSEHAALVVVGRRSEAGEKSMFVGSTAVGLAGTSACPVAVTSTLSAHERRTGVIGVGLDPGAHGIVAVEWAMKRAARLGARVQVVTVLKKPQGRFFRAVAPVGDEQVARAMADVRGRAQAAIDGVAAKVPGVPVELDVRYGSPIEELVAASEELDMLIVGVHPGFPTYSVGGVVRGLMTHADCTLGLVRHK